MTNSFEYLQSHPNWKAHRKTLPLTKSLWLVCTCFCLGGVKRLLELNLWMHAYHPGHTRRPASWRAREQLARCPPPHDGFCCVYCRHIPLDRWTRFDERANERAAGRDLLFGCGSSFFWLFQSKWSSAASCFCLFMSFFFYGFHTSLFKLSRGRRANSAAVLHHSDLPLSHAGKAMCTQCKSMQFKMCFWQKMKIKLN